MTKFALRTAGRLSDGIRECLQQGFDSGAALDYVYRNRAAGITPLGQLIDSDPSPRPWRAAALWLSILGPGFFLVYGLCNWYASQLPDVPSFYYSWERSIPFVPALILPYFSIDFFFAASLFLCRDRRELRGHAYRIGAAIMISALGFIVFPLKFAFDRPVVDGFNGFLFGLLDGFDKPFNQAPSLHVSLLMILWARYAHHLAGLWRWLLHGWFTLIGLSIFFVYQHHVVDIWSGFIVGVVCLYGWPDAPRQWCGFSLTGESPRRRLGAYYLSASGLLVGLAVTLQYWAWSLLWPAASLLLVALAYFGAGPAVFQKLSGRHSWPARWLLAPYLFGAWISYRCFTRGRRASDEVVEGLYLGRLPRRGEIDRLKNFAVIDLTAEFSLCRGSHSITYLNIPMLDLAVPEAAALRAAAQFIDEQIILRPVYVHCALGLSRSASVVAAWLVRVQRVGDAGAALRQLREIRPGVTWSPAHIAAITAAADRDERQ